ncbi:MAG: Ig domain-containing protein [Chitinophagaceae bacterium]
MKTLLLVLVVIMAAAGTNGQVILKDKFGRNLSGQNIILTDWEGYMANPAIRLSMQASGVSYPFTINLSANGARLYFDRPSEVGASGPTKEIILENADPVYFYLSIFPDRDSLNETYTLTINSSLGSQPFTISVIDQDHSNPPSRFNIIADFSQDTAHHFFDNNSYKQRVQQAANDWAYFIRDMQLDTVAANTEQTIIYGDDYLNNRFVYNAAPYSGFLLYPYGIHNAAHHSGGGGSTYDLQKIGGVPTQLLRSGEYETEIHGNFNTLGWDTSITDNTWYNATNFSDVAADLYSVAMHEIGHSICFYTGYPVFGVYEMQGYVDDTDVVKYQGANVLVDGNDHLSNGETEDSLKFVDRISRRGAFGSDNAAIFPWGRWLITKVDLLCLKAVGYQIGNTSAFSTVNISTASVLPNGLVSTAYNSPVAATGGIPFYKFSLSAGSLPAGITVNSFSGAISGTPTTPGNYSGTITVTDYDDKAFSKTFSIYVAQRFTFNGNGDWADTNNWLNHLAPPASLTAGMEVTIDPATGGQCIFTGNISLLKDCKITVATGKKFTIKP